MTTRVQNVLGISPTGQLVPWQPRSLLGNADSTKICSVISAYRLLDVMAMLNGALPAPSVPRQYFEVQNKRVNALSLFT